MKYLASAIALALCVTGCAHKQTTTSCKLPAAPTVMAVELRGGDKEQAMVCSDDLDCLKKLTGFCANGYSGSRNLHGENDKVVGVLFHCVTDEEKAEEAADKAQEEAARAEYAKRLQEAAQKAAAAKKHK